MYVTLANLRTLQRMIVQPKNKDSEKGKLQIILRGIFVHLAGTFFPLKGNSLRT